MPIEHPRDDHNLVYRLLPFMVTSRWCGDHISHHLCFAVRLALAAYLITRGRVGQVIAGPLFIRSNAS